MSPTITDVIERIQNQRVQLGITLYPKASPEDIVAFEVIRQIKLPDDFKTFYSFCNGFESEEDLFRIIPLHEIIEKGSCGYLEREKDFHFAEYMIYCDMWSISINDKNKSYSIYNNNGKVAVLTNSLAEFLNIFLDGGVFDGLYKWQEEIKQSH
ncbi:hypothetical protein A3860_02100 [Niastella vici]|uniref:Knr4/Smi1-like domain-containing protein n=1 Tax=Niastella vici TaxID=1703345 RepID=A0A1V9G962_9BACT|nr:SMI1/KNR4 family protein [Niastella vici]OQP67175.1 hypothetical protein A3860_02100 [Niastella vici]